MDLELLGRVFGIILIDLMLSGDNAVVIGMAARSLPPAQRRKAIVLGGGAAVGLRILFTALATVLLVVPLLKAVGGVLLIWIAFRLLRREDDSEEAVREGRNLLDAVRVIVVADVVMSLDNILAVGGTAHGNLWLLLFGLALSIPLLLVGSGLIATLMNRFSWLVWLGAVVLAWTAGQMVAEDPTVHQYLEAMYRPHIVVPALVTAFVVGIAFAWNHLTRQKPDTKQDAARRIEEHTEAHT